MNFTVKLPDSLKSPELNEEFVEVQFEDGRAENIFLHDYQRIYQIKNLFEEIFVNKLGSDSHNFVCRKLLSVMARRNLRPSESRVLELGAGNGVTSQTFKDNGFKSIVAIDVLPEAKEAAMRDRGATFEDYLVSDSSNLFPPDASALKNKFDVLLIVAAIGMGHVDSHSIKAGFNLLNDHGILAFNIYSKLINQTPPTEFDEMLAQFTLYLDLLVREEYVHRKSVTGSDVKYTLFIFQKR